MAVPLTVLDTVLVNEATLERNQLLVHIANTLNDLLESLLRELGFVMSELTLGVFLLVDPGRVPSNTGFEIASILRTNNRRVDVAGLKPGLVGANAFLAKDTLDLADSSSDVTLEDSLSDDVFDNPFEFFFGLEFLFVKFSTCGLKVLNGLLEIGEVYVEG